MTIRLMRSAVAVLGLVTVLAGSAWTVSAAQKKGGKRPILQTSVQQLERVKDRLQKAPSDYGGHKAAAIDALNRAMTELNQAIALDKK